MVQLSPLQIINFTYVLRLFQALFTVHHTIVHIYQPLRSARI